MREIPGKYGGRIRLSEKGDPSPNKGKRKVTTAALIKEWRKKGMAQMGKGDYLAALRFLFELTPKELIALVKSDESLPAALAIESKGWLDKRFGSENLRKSVEKVFGKSLELPDAVKAGITINLVNSPDAKKVKDMWDGEIEDLDE